MRGFEHGDARDIDAESLRMSADELGLGDAGYREVLEAAPDAIVIVGGDGRILFVNRQTERLFGYAREELLGQLIEKLVPDRFRGHHTSQRSAYVASPRVRPMAAALELYGLRKNASEFAAEISLSPIDSTKERRVIATIRDVSERRRFERQRRDRDESEVTYSGPRVLKWRELELDQARHRVFIAGAELVLPPLEFCLAVTLLKSPGRSFTHAELLQLVWDAAPEVEAPTVDRHVRRLRELLGEYGQAIETMHGYGYRWRLEA